MLDLQPAEVNELRNSLDTAILRAYRWLSLNGSQKKAEALTPSGKRCMDAVNCAIRDLQEFEAGIVYVLVLTPPLGAEVLAHCSAMCPMPPATPCQCRQHFSCTSPLSLALCQPIH